MSTPFDFEAFITGTQLARIPVWAYGEDLRGEIDALTEQHDAIAEQGDDRESDGPSRRHDLAQQIVDLRIEMEASRVEWTLRTLTPQEMRDHLERQSAEDGRAGTSDGAFEQIAAQSRPPAGCRNPSLYSDLTNLTADQWRQISEVIGAAQWIVLYSEATDGILSRVAVPDFSRSVLATLKPPAPSEN